MPLKSTTSFENVSATIDAIYNAAIDTNFWQGALKQTADLLGGMFSLVAFEATHETFTSHHFVSDQSSDIMTSYGEYYRQIDPVIAAAIRAPALEVITDRMVMPRSEAVRSEIYCDFARPRGIETVAHAFPVRTADTSLFVAICRSKQAGEFEAEHIKLLSLILPHLRRAMSVHVRLDQAEIRERGMVEALDRLGCGTLLVDESSRIILINRAADELLARNDGIGVNNRRLRAATSTQTATLRHLVANASDSSRLKGRGGAVRLKRQSMRPPLSVVVAPLNIAASKGLPGSRPTAVVFVADLDRAPRIHTSPLRELYGLTDAEATVAAHVAQGHGVKDAAASLNIAPSTVRWHLKHVFDKTGTERQAELARLVERVGILIGDISEN